MFSMFRAKLNLTGSSLSANSVYQFPPSLPSLSSLRRLSIRVRKFDDGGLLSSSRPFRNPNRGVTRILHLNSNHSIIIFRYLEPFSLSIVHLLLSSTIIRQFFFSSSRRSWNRARSISISFFFASEWLSFVMSS